MPMRARRLRQQARQQAGLRPARWRLADEGIEVVHLVMAHRPVVALSTLCGGATSAATPPLISAYLSSQAVFNPSLASIIISAGEVPGW